MSRPPLRGYNHNLRYRDRVYHVQTEDSGLGNPHVFTHLYHGGVIIATAKGEYADIAADPNHVPQLKKLMQTQHKRLMKQLLRGEFDEKITHLLGSLVGDLPKEDGVKDGPVAAPAEAAPDATAAVGDDAIAEADDAAARQAEIAAASAQQPASIETDALRDDPTPADGIPSGLMHAAESSPHVPALEPPVALSEPFGSSPAAASPAHVPAEPPHAPPPPRASATPQHAPMRARVELPDDDAPTAGVPVLPGVTGPAAPRQQPATPRPVFDRQIPTPYDDGPTSVESLPAYPSIPPRAAPGAGFGSLEDLAAAAEPPAPAPATGRATAAVPPAQERSLTGEEDALIDRPPDGWTQPAGPAAPAAGQRHAAPRARQQSMFDQPLPKESRLLTPSEMLDSEGAEPGKRRSGVYQVPGPMPPRPPHPDPTVRGQQRPPTPPSIASSPQRYTAPSRRGAAPARTTTIRGRHTGSYRVPSGVIPVSEVARARQAQQQQAQDQALSGTPPERSPRHTQPRISAPAVRRQPAGGGYARGGHPAADPGQPPGVVVARPAIIVDGRPAEIPPPRQAPPPVHPGAPPSRPPRATARPAPDPSQQRPPAGQRPPRATVGGQPSIFGADLISERSLDEVILGYLAEEDKGEG